MTVGYRQAPFEAHHGFISAVSMFLTEEWSICCCSAQSCLGFLETAWTSYGLISRRVFIQSKASKMNYFCTFLQVPVSQYALNLMLDKTIKTVPQTSQGTKTIFGTHAQVPGSFFQSLSCHRGEFVFNPEQWEEGSHTDLQADSSRGSCRSSQRSIGVFWCCRPGRWRTTAGRAFRCPCSPESTR